MEMKVCGEAFCRLCLNTIIDENFTVIDDTTRKIFNGLLLELDLKENTVSVTCNTCHTKALDAIQFKATCTATEKCIVHYVNSKNGAPVDLIEVYLEERSKEHLRNALEDEKICRLCMEICTLGSTPVKDLDSDLTHIYIPEIDFNSTIKPVVCVSCVDSLYIHTHFLKNVLKKKEEVWIKTEETEIKSEEDDIGDASVSDDVTFEDQTSRGHQTTHENLSHHRQPAQKIGPEVYQCDRCSYKNKLKKNLTRHQLTHKSISELPVYNCDKCGFQTNYKASFSRHELIHKDVGELPMHRCPTCTYESKGKQELQRHLLTHRDNSEVRTYKCDSCAFESKYKTCLVRHRLIHKEKSGVEVYTCSACSFKTTRKEHLTSHQQSHKDVSEVPVYTCATCGYVTRRKSRLRDHMLQHMDSSKLPMYTCESCAFETKYRISLVRHQSVHKDKTAVQKYKCESCDYATTRKRDLKTHQRGHNDSS